MSTPLRPPSWSKYRSFPAPEFSPAPSRAAPPSGDRRSDSVTVAVLELLAEGVGTVCVPLLLAPSVLQCLDSSATMLHDSAALSLVLLCSHPLHDSAPLCVFCSPLDGHLHGFLISVNKAATNNSCTCLWGDTCTDFSWVRCCVRGKSPVRH